MYPRLRSLLSHVIVPFLVFVGTVFAGAELAKAQSILDQIEAVAPYSAIDGNPEVAITLYLFAFFAACVAAYALVVHAPLSLNPMRRLHVWWRNELARELDVDEEVYTFFNFDSREVSEHMRFPRLDRMMIVGETRKSPPRIVIART